MRKFVFATFALALIGLIAGCHRSNPVAPQKPTMNGTWEWRSIALPKTPWPDTSIIGTIAITSTNGTISSSQKFPNGSACVISGTDAYPKATLSIDFGHGAKWTSNCSYITPDSVVGYDLGILSDTIGCEIFTRLN